MGAGIYWFRVAWCGEGKRGVGFRGCGLEFRVRRLNLVLTVF